MRFCHDAGALENFAVEFHLRFTVLASPMDTFYMREPGNFSTMWSTAVGRA